MFHGFRSVLIGALMVLASAAASYAAVSAAMPGALLAAGTTRYAAASGDTSESVSAGDGWVDIPGMIKYITIPGGMTADVMVTFCGMIRVSTVGTERHVRAMIRDAPASPERYLIKTSDLEWSTQCATYYKTSVTAGSPAVKMQWATGAFGTVEIFWRNMIVVVNLH